MIIIGLVLSTATPICPHVRRPGKSIANRCLLWFSRAAKESVTYSACGLQMCGSSWMDQMNGSRQNRFRKQCTTAQISRWAVST